MSLDFSLVALRPVEVFEANITHNLGKMASESGIYKALWRPEEIKATIAKDIIPMLEEGIKKLKDNPDKYKKFDSPNGWGTYEHFVEFVEEVLDACKNNPSAEIKVSR